MLEHKTDSAAGTDLRRGVAPQVRAHAAEHPADLTPERLCQLTHELEVHRDDLELQQEELRRLQRDLAVAQLRYCELYDLAPIGYVTLNKQGLIQEANLTAASLCGRARPQLIQRPLSQFIIQKDQAAYRQHHQRLFTPEGVARPRASRAAAGPGGPPQACELRLARPDGVLLWVRLEAGAVLEAGDTPVARIVMSDITERKQVETALRESSANFGKLYESITDLIVACTPDGRLLFANAAVTRALGYSTAELARMHMLDLHPPALRPEAEDIFAAIGRGERDNCPLPLATQSGALVPLETRVWRGMWDGAECLFGISRDLSTEQEAGQRFERLFRNNPAPMALTDLMDQRFTDVNDAFLRVLGFAKDEIIGKATAELALFPHPEQQAALAEQLQAQGRIVECELQIRRKDGQLLDGLFSGDLISSQGRQYFLTVMSDITARKRAEAERQASEQKFRLLVEHIHDVFWMSTPALDRIIYISPSYEHHWGRTCASLYANPASFADAVHPADQARVVAAFAGHVRGEWMLEYRILRPDGDVRWMLDRGSPVRDEHGALLYMCGVATDITARKQAEAERQTAETLAREKTALIKSIMESSQGVIIFALDAAYRYTEFTTTHRATMQQLWGVEIAVGMNMLDCIRDPADRAKAQGNFDRTLRGEALLIEEQYGDNALTRSYYENRYSPIIDHAGAVTGLTVFAIDISVRRRAQAALQESEEKFSALVAQSPLSIQLVDTRGKTLLVNRAFEELWGTPFALMEDYNLLEDPQFQDLGIKHLLLRAFAGEAVEFPPVTFTVHNGFPAGRQRVVHALAYPIKDQAGTVCQVVLTHRDITQVTEATTALQASEERYRLVSENGSDIIWLFDLAANRFAFLSPSVEKLLGYPLEEARALTLLDALTPEALRLVGEVMPRRLAAFAAGDDAVRTQSHELEQIRKDGTRVWTEVVTTLVADEQRQVTHLQGVTRDISGRKQAEAALQARELKYRRIFENIQDVFYEVTLEGIVEEVSPSIAAISRGQYTREDLLGRSMYDFYASPQIRDSLIQVLREKGSVTDHTVGLKNRDGSVIPCSLSAKLLTNAAGQPVRITGTLRDITERKELEAQLLRSQRLESIGRLAGGIAHDLNNILAPVLLASPLLRAAIRDPDARNLVDMVETSTRRGAEIIKQLLTFSRGLKGERAPLQLGLVVHEMCAIMRETFPKNIALRAELPAGIPLITGDTTQLHQVLLNLCVNARDAMPDGGQLTLSLEAVTLDTVSATTNPAARPGRYVVLGIADSGTGITPAHLDKIFDPFFTTKPIGKGSGLGLSTTLGIVRSHAGFIKVQSAPGAGTQFRVFLPASVAGETSGEAPPTVSRPPPGHGEVVLVVDDEKAVRDMARRLLESKGYRVFEAEDGVEALRLIQGMNAPPQVVLTDLLMPRMDGPALIRALRQLAVPLKIIAMGGLPPSEELQQLGLTEELFLNKPFDAATLLKTLHAALT
jgi:PAS domain S-box-containing protein